ncbi:acyltransferase [Acidisoma cellulosilytica]|uniref:Acyltransferase n=1 Tax=Acidisoma cellulosilyticum TaxID=2802395 RepID=A0A963Z0G6_9PROT|nr:acyltransferase [Acidisoma cellulosilyticum]MCB8879560.1 acyltransferase [Acidisoma cellulosilyticum]
MNERNWRRRDIDRGKTLGVLLVVLGHLVARQDPVGQGWGSAWYEPLRAALYSFHIPFLFYLSGYTAGWSGAASLTGRAYRAMLGRRAKHWLLPALLFGLAVACGKVALHPLMPVDHAPASLGAGLLALVWQTDQSPAQSVWYLVVLFGFAALVPVMRQLTGAGILPLLLLCLPLMALPLPPVLYADRFLLYLPFYLAGLLAAEQDRPWCRFLDKARWPLMLIFLAVLPVLMLRAASWPRPETMLGASLIALPALHAMIRRLWLPLLRALDRLGPYAFAIYLLNTVFIGLAKAALLQILPWTAASFAVYAPVLMAAGVLGPILAARLWRECNRNPALQRRI